MNKPSSSALAHASTVIAISTYALAVLSYNGAFVSDCGRYGLNCLGYGLMTLGVGCVLGLILAIASFCLPGTSRWLSWLGVFFNVLPALAIGAAAVFFT